MGNDIVDYMYRKDDIVYYKSKDREVLEDMVYDALYEIDFDIFGYDADLSDSTNNRMFKAKRIVENLKWEKVTRSK